jgi:polysaccharide export outer membrane protein
MRSNFRSLQLIFFSLVCLAMLVTGSAHAESGRDTINDYTIGTGDNIRIHVFQEEDLSIETRIGDTGIISYPLLGEIRVKGLTVSELESRITRGLKGDYLVNPQVSVSISEYRQFFINGEVKSPGAYSYAPGLTVRKAISIAGGFSERADRDNLFILNENSANDKAQRVTIDQTVRPGDIITIEQSFF